MSFTLIALLHEIEWRNDISDIFGVFVKTHSIVILVVMFAVNDRDWWYLLLQLWWLTVWRCLIVVTYSLAVFVVTCSDFRRLVIFLGVFVVTYSLAVFVVTCGDLRRLVIFFSMLSRAFRRLMCRCLVSSWCHSWYRDKRWGTCSPPIVLAALFPDKTDAMSQLHHM